MTDTMQQTNVSYQLATRWETGLYNHGVDERGNLMVLQNNGDGTWTDLYNETLLGEEIVARYFADHMEPADKCLAVHTHSDYRIVEGKTVWARVCDLCGRDVPVKDEPPSDDIRKMARVVDCPKCGLPVFPHTVGTGNVGDPEEEGYACECGWMGETVEPTTPDDEPLPF